MNEAAGVIVVGGGPAGSFTALRLAQREVKVEVYEEHGEIGIPTHCAGHLSMKGLERLGMSRLPQEIVENTYRGANFYSPNGNKFSVRFSSPITCAVDRALFDKHIARKAMHAGASYNLNSKVESLTFENGFARGIRVRHKGRIEEKRSEIVVDAEGISARLLRQTNLPLCNHSLIVNGLEAKVENVKNTELDMVDVFLGADYAPGFYAWLMPLKNGQAKVGLATRTGNPKEFLLKLITRHPSASQKLHGAHIIELGAHPLTLGGPIKKTHLDGFLAVGDAASQVKSTTGGGVILGMTCAAIAADVSAEAIEKSDVSARFLSKYQETCSKSLGFDARMMVRMRKTLNALSDGKLDGFITWCSKLGIEKTFGDTEEIDLQGKTFLRVIRSPRVLPALSYFFSAFLVRNLKSQSTVR